ncbi:tyrosine-type recombinase/integrase [Histophilus somni]|uniref:tyrosine-type recombinase/integrase n=1 Tax=Histophilus somni TaxID=731 RepID=UPI00201F038B|nr:site-specific integrase [Histophilus somni]
MADFEQSNREALTKLLFRWQLLSMVRPAEAVSVEWNEIDLSKKIWVIPEEKMKKVRTGRFSYSVPLSRQMTKILEQLKPITGHHKYVFPSFTKPNQAMSKDTIANSLREIGYQGKQDAHGLRAIARTYLEDNMIDFRLAESCLAHKIGDKVSQVYNRADYIEQRRPIMQLWGDYVHQNFLINQIDSKT